jgi:FAD binding domain
MQATNEIPTRLYPRLDDRLRLPGDRGYDEARTVWNSMVDRFPAAVFPCAGIADVRAAVRLARESDLEIGVRCGGHNIAGLSVPDGGLMIDLRPMRSVTIDRDRAAPGSREERCSAPSIAPPRPTVWRPPRATSRTPASAASPSVAVWAGLPAGTG